MPPKSIVLACVFAAALTLPSVPATVVSSCPERRCSDGSDAGAVVQRANAPARRASPPAVAAVSHEPGTPSRSTAATLAGTQPLAPAPQPPLARLGIKLAVAHDSCTQANLRPIPAEAPKPRPRAQRRASSASGMKTLVELSQSGGRVIG